MKRFPRFLGLGFALVLVAASVASAAGTAPEASAPKTLYDAYPDVAKTITVKGETWQLIGFDTKSGETIYGGKHSVQNMLDGISKDGPTVKTLLSYPSLPASVHGDVGTNSRRDDPPGCTAPYTLESTDSRAYGRPGIVLEYRYALTVWWTVDCRTAGVVDQTSSADYEAGCGDGSATATDTVVNNYSRRSLGNYRFRVSCLQQTKTRWLRAVTNGFAITWTASEPSEKL